MDRIHLLLYDSAERSIAARIVPPVTARIAALIDRRTCPCDFQVEVTMHPSLDLSLHISESRCIRLFLGKNSTLL